jgi:hypothetical protein
LRAAFSRVREASEASCWRVPKHIQIENFEQGWGFTLQEPPPDQAMREHDS